MRNFIRNSTILLPTAALLFVAGCDSSDTTVLSQQVDAIAWLPDGSGMLVYIDKTYENVDGSESEGANLYQASNTGNVGNSLNPTDLPVDVNYVAPPMIFISPDGKTAITQFYTDVYSVPTSGGNVTDLIQNTAVYGVDSGMNYAVTSPIAQGNPPIFTVYDLDNNPITTPSGNKTISGLGGNRALWLSNEQFALTINDGVTPAGGEVQHVAIYDVNGNLVSTDSNGDVSFSAGAYAAGSGDLFVRTVSYGIDRIHLATGKRSTMVSNDSVYSMDVSQDGQTLVYVSSDSATNWNLYSVNTADTNKIYITTNVAKPVLSPDATKAAYIDNSGNLQMTPITKPN